MATEPVPEAVREPTGEPVLTAPEPFGKGPVDQRDRHLLFERLLYGPGAGRPASDVIGDVAEVTALLPERLLAEFEQPGSDDRTVRPGSGDCFEVEVVPAVVEEFEPLAVCLH